MDQIKNETNWSVDTKKKEEQHKASNSSSYTMQAYHFVSNEKGLLKCEKNREKG